MFIPGDALGLFFCPPFSIGSKQRSLAIRCGPGAWSWNPSHMWVPSRPYVVIPKWHLASWEGNFFRFSQVPGFPGAVAKCTPVLPGLEQKGWRSMDIWWYLVSRERVVHSLIMNRWYQGLETLVKIPFAHICTFYGSSFLLFALCDCAGSRRSRPEPETSSQVEPQKHSANMLNSQGTLHKETIFYCTKKRYEKSTVALPYQRIFWMLSIAQSPNDGWSLMVSLSLISWSQQVMALALAEEAGSRRDFPWDFVQCGAWSMCHSGSLKFFQPTKAWRILRPLCNLACLWMLETTWQNLNTG